MVEYDPHAPDYSGTTTADWTPRGEVNVGPPRQSAPGGAHCGEAVDEDIGR